MLPHLLIEAVELGELGLDHSAHVLESPGLDGLTHGVDVNRELVADGVELAAEIEAQLRLALDLFAMLVGPLVEVLDDLLDVHDEIRHVVHHAVVVVALLLEGDDASLR